MQLKLCKTESFYIKELHLNIASMSYIKITRNTNTLDISFRRNQLRITIFFVYQDQEKVVLWPTSEYFEFRTDNVFQIV